MGAQFGAVANGPEGTSMIPRNQALCVCGLGMLLGAVGLSNAQDSSLPRLEKTIPLPGVKGRIDHLAFDGDHQRLYVAALGNNTVEIVDVKGGTVLHSIGGQAEPQGLLYEPQRKRLWIANGGDGSVRIFDAMTFEQVRLIALGDDADNIRRDLVTGRVLVGYGSGGIAIFDPDGNKLGDIKVDAHPESFQLERYGNRMFVNLPGSHKVAVIDRAAASVVASWPTDGAQSNFPMALDEADARLMIVCRSPAVLLVLDTRSGAVVAKLPTVGDSDDVFYDRNSRRIYVSGDDGAIAVYQQQGADEYSKVAEMQTVKGARTSLFVPELGRLFVAARQEGASAAAILVYEMPGKGAGAQ
jgi:DNA-binding beta-propeller fold protein YncE